MILKPSPISTRRFFYQKDAGLLTAEISDFGPGFGFGQVYDDACDEGLTLVSHKTGTEVTYGVEHVERDREGDLLYWDLRPADRKLDYLPTVRIFND